jgi:PIN domain nuclease of toxin-antitoxin system
MRLLVDTHLVLWAVAASNRLPTRARELFEDASNEIYCSAASLWEIAIKSALRRADFDVDLRLLRAALPEMAVRELPVDGRHIEQLATLPPIHKDPFDRLLIAQALAEPLVLLTSDATVARYGEGVLVVE